ncbi:hypothetical protein ABIB25_003584 [Nakamurella sp. UYEF19]|uniref:choice-of-anchor G family protein n=1 Tax=Nakamurella sp. UYEF19 TaxID=1756392 RepID=UPI00339195BE
MTKSTENIYTKAPHSRHGGVKSAGTRRRTLAAILTFGLVASGSVFLAGTAAAVQAPVAQSQGRFLSGTIGVTNLDNVAALVPATAVNTGGPAVVNDHPLDATVLNAIDLPLGNGIALLGNQGILTLGAVEQYAKASPDGSSYGASGALDNNGAISTGAGTPGIADAQLDLTALAGAGSLTGVISAGTLNVGAVSGTANQTAAGVQSGTYKIASLKLNLSSPLIANLTSGLNTTLTGLQPVVNGIQTTLNGLLVGLVTVNGLPNLGTLTSGLTTVTSADQSITVNLQTGAITVDVNKLLITAGLDINNLPPNTQLLPKILNALTTQLVPAITSALTGLITQITASLGNVTATVAGIPVSLAILTPVLNGVITQVTAPITTASGTVGSTLIPQLGTGLSALLSLKANVQPTAPSGPTFTERALSIGLLPGVGGVSTVATVNLGSATVGPNGLTGLFTLSLDPDHGTPAGGTSVTITGGGFVPGATSVTIGGNTVPASQVTVNAAGTTATFLTPPHPTGGVGVTVTVGGVTSSPPLGYYYGIIPVATCILTGGGAATITVVADTGLDTSLVPSQFTVTTTNGVNSYGDPVATTPLLGGFLVVQTSAPVPDNTPFVAYTLAATTGTPYTPILSAPIPCTQITPPQSKAGVYHPLPTPARLLDTRYNIPVGTTTPVGPLGTATVQILGRGGVPATDVASVVINLTATDPTQAGFLTVYPDGTRPNTSSLNYGKAQTVANLVVAPVGADGKIRIYNSTGGTTNVLVDVQGYFSSGDTVAPGSYVRLNPTRILDTNARIGVPTSTPVPANGTVKLQVGGFGGVPTSNVSAVALNVTVDQTHTIGFITVYPSGAQRPEVSSLNFLANTTAANLVITPIAADGTVLITNTSGGGVRLIADVSGYFLGGIPILDGEFVAVTPSRILDTRNNINLNGAVPRLGTIAPTMLGRNGIPATGVGAVVMNVTVDHPVRNGYITVYPQGTRPEASNLNFVPKVARANADFATIGADGKVRMFNGSGGTVDLITDVSGYFIKNPLL